LVSNEDTGRFWTLVGITSIVALVILAVMAVAVVVSELTATDDSETFTISEPVGAVHLTTNGGHVEVVGSDESGIEVKRTSHYSILEPDGIVEVDEMTLMLSDGCARSVLLIPNCTVDFELRVPMDTDVTVNGTRTDVTVTGISGELRVDTTGADIELNSTAGAITIEAAGSDIHSNEISGPGAAVSTTEGSILLDYVDPPGVIAATTNIGPVTVLVPQNSYVVEVSAANGDVEVDVINDPTSERIIAVTNSAGDVAILARP
jgi:hypothetical protein